MTDNVNDLVKEWYRFSMMDLNAAKYLCGMQPKPLEIICYHCRQSAEKMLKDFLIANSIDPPKIHDLRRLCEMCMEINDIFANLKDVCIVLNPYGVQPRYPDEMELLDEDVEKALRNVQAMVEFFESHAGLNSNCEQHGENK